MKKKIKKKQCDCEMFGMMGECEHTRKEKKKTKRMFDSKKKLYWIKKSGKYWNIGTNEFNIMDYGYTKNDAKEMFLERMIIMYGDLLKKLQELHMAYSGFDLPDISDLEDFNDGK